MKRFFFFFFFLKVKAGTLDARVTWRDVPRDQYFQSSLRGFLLLTLSIVITAESVDNEKLHSIPRHTWTTLMCFNELTPTNQVFPIPLVKLDFKCID